MKSFDLRQFRVITLEDVDNAVKAGAKEMRGAGACDSDALGEGCMHGARDYSEGRLLR